LVLININAFLLALTVSQKQNSFYLVYYAVIFLL